MTTLAPARVHDGPSTPPAPERFIDVSSEPTAPMGARTEAPSVERSEVIARRSSVPARASMMPVPSLAVAAQMAELRARRANHPLWSGRLFGALAEGALTRDDLRFVFSQYSLYSRNFTRYLAALMANCDDDLFRSEISENLWEEGGGCEPAKRHAQLFRDFLTGSFGVDPSAIEFTDYTRYFVREYLDFCMRSSSLEASAFLSLGTEGIVAQTYELFVEGMHKAGLKDDELTFFYIHMACDDGHAETLENMLSSYASEPSWFAAAERSMNRALDLRHSFFESLFDTLQQRRIRSIVDKIQARKTLSAGRPAESSLHHRSLEPGTALYANAIERLNIEFNVDRLPMHAEVLDTRVVRIPAGKYNERHRHAHETVFYVMQGSGRVIVDGSAIEVQAGDTVFVPRWAMHQSQNTSSGELVILAVTDFGLTGKAYVGDYDKTARDRAGRGSL